MSTLKHTGHTEMDLVPSQLLHSLTLKEIPSVLLLDTEMQSNLPSLWR